MNNAATGGKPLNFHIAQITTDISQCPGVGMAGDNRCHRTVYYLKRSLGRQLRNINDRTQGVKALYRGHTFF